MIESIESILFGLGFIKCIKDDFYQITRRYGNVVSHVDYNLTIQVEYEPDLSEIIISSRKLDRYAQHAISIYTWKFLPKSVKTYYIMDITDKLFKYIEGNLSSNLWYHPTLPLIYD